MNSKTPPASTPSSVSSASHYFQPRDGDQQITKTLEDTHLHLLPNPNPNPNANANGFALPHKPPRAKMANRFSRMFSQTGKSFREGLETPKGDSSDALSSDQQTKRPSARPGSGSPVSANGNGAQSKSPTKGLQPADKKAVDKKQAEKKQDGDKKHAKEPPPAIKRFEILPDHSHVHHLRSAKRQEKLTDMLRDMLGGGRKKEEHVDEQQLSLMSTWVDQLKNEREKMAAEKKGGPSTTASLVEKYGKCQEVVGRGAFGIVRISHKTDPRDSKVEQLYAVKEFRRRPQETVKKYQKRLTSEFCISSSLRHPNIIHTLDLMQDSKGDYCEVMEFCAGGDLYTLVLAAGKLDVGEADCYFKQLMRGVEYMHEMGVAHRDLKPENLLLTTHGSIKITDFGNGECFRMAWEKEAHLTAGLCGSAPYIAPEEYTDKEFDPRAVDVWATGVIYMAMRTGRHLWRQAQKDEDEFYEQYLEGRRDEDGYAPIETLHRVCLVLLRPQFNGESTPLTSF